MLIPSPILPPPRTCNENPTIEKAPTNKPTPNKVSVTANNLRLPKKIYIKPTIQIKATTTLTVAKVFKLKTSFKDNKVEKLTDPVYKILGIYTTT